MRISILIFWGLHFSSLPLYTQVISAGNSSDLNRIIHIGDSIVAVHTGKSIFEKYYRFAPEYSLISRDTLGQHMKCAWTNNNIGRGTSFELCYGIKTNTFAAEGLHVFLNADGKEYHASTGYGKIPNAVNGKSPEFISRKEVFDIAKTNGLTDTFNLSCTLVIIPTNDSSQYVYRLQLIFDTQSEKQKHIHQEQVFTQHILLLNPWTHKITSSKTLEYQVTPPQDVMEIQEKPPEVK